MSRGEEDEPSAFTSRGFEEPTWKSPRRIDEENRLYIRKRFESYMTMEERGELTRELALRALREEIAYAKELDNE